MRSSQHLDMRAGSRFSRAHVTHGASEVCTPSAHLLAKESHSHVVPQLRAVGLNCRRDAVLYKSSIIVSVVLVVCMCVYMCVFVCECV